MEKQNRFVALCDNEAEMVAASAEGLIAVPSSDYKNVAEYMDGFGLSKPEAQRLGFVVARRRAKAYAEGLEIGKEEAIASLRLQTLFPLFWREIKRLF